MTKKIFIYTLFSLLFAFGAVAQNIKNSISLELTGGYSSFLYQTNIGERGGMAGTSVALKYQYNINWNWSVGIGGEFKMYQSSTRFDTYTDSYQAFANSLISGKADEMTFSYAYKNLEERQRALYINIPIYAQYKFDNGLYIRAGAKVGFPIKSGSEIYFAELSTKGYFPLENVTYTNLPQHGFGTFYNTEVDKSYKMALNAALCAELGWAWDWNEQYVLYLGIHGEYGLSNMYKRSQLMPQLQYNGGELDYTPTWNADVRSGEDRVPITGDKIGVFAIGLLVRYSFGF